MLVVCVNSVVRLFLRMGYKLVETTEPDRSSKLSPSDQNFPYYQHTYLQSPTKYLRFSAISKFSIDMRANHKVLIGQHAVVR